MALTDEQKIQILQDAACDYFHTLDTIPKWINFINNVTKSRVKTFLINAIYDASTNYDNTSESFATKATDYESFGTEVNAI